MAFVLPLFLLGIGAIAFPLYFHLKRSKGVEIEVPSLLMFTQFKLVKPRSGEKHYLLLLSRLLLLIILSLMMTRPFIESDQKLALPLLVDETSQLNYLGIVLDDSLTAMQSSGNQTKFEVSKKQLIKTLEQYSEETAVYLCLTSNAIPIGPITVKKCQKMLENINPLTIHGSAFSALKSLTLALNGKKGRIVVATTKNQHLWRDSEKLPPSYIDFMDADAKVLKPIIRQISMESTHNFTILKVSLDHLQNDTKIIVFNAITNDVLSEMDCKDAIVRVGISGQSGIPIRVELTSGDALFGSHYLTLDSAQKNPPKFLSLANIHLPLTP